jgi:hypothetical protein
VKWVKMMAKKRGTDHKGLPQRFQTKKEINKKTNQKLELIEISTPSKGAS